MKQALPAAAADVKTEFGIGVEDASVKKKRVRAKDYEGFSTEQKGSVEDVKTHIDRNALALRPHKNLPVRDRVADDEESDESPDLERYNDRMGSSDEDDDMGGVSDMDAEELERKLLEEGIPRKSASRESREADPVADLSVSDGDYTEISEDEEPGSVAPAPKKSAFMPSLTLGGYISGSGSDLDDEMHDNQPKKNRRGQRARQAIWEKKYGRSAKHLQRPDAKTGWEPKHGAVDGGARPGGNRFAKDANKLPLGRKNRTRPGPSPSAGNGAKKSTPSKDDSGPLHPSWEAAKRAKEKKSVPVAFQGKKISFD